ncbi:MAG TPA: EAL domain-containing protein [Candidatus Acidoferrum sp.]|nr:EAL domain-containing protein [Candidatus Acidoferrum sp.]
MNAPLILSQWTERSEREQMLEMLLSALEGMVYRCRVDAHWTMEFVSRGCHKLTGYRPEQLLGNACLSYDDLTHPADRERVHSDIRAALAKGAPFELEYRIQHADGSVKWVWERGAALISLDGGPQLIHGFIQDITDRHLHERALRKAEQRYRSIFENANEGIFQTTVDGLYLDVNPALATIYGYQSPQALIEALDDIGQQLYVEPGRRDEFIRQMAQHSSVTNFESRVFRKDRSIIWISENAHAVYDAEGHMLYYEGTVEDITQRKEYEQRIAWQATHDALTGLPNRTLLSERIETAILEAGRQDGNFAVVFIDLDNFKTVNDTMGHQAGDVLIRKVAERLQLALRTGDTVARIGGDEFVLLLREIQVDYTVLSKLMDRLLAVISEPYMLGEHDFTLGCSMGISLHPADGMNAETLLRHADIAMYQAKEAGRNNYQFFTEEFNRSVMESHELEKQLRYALAQQSLELHYQPIVDAHSGLPVKAEALLRWQMPERGYVSPARFIPIAEKTGLIEAIGNWVLDAVCRQLAEWARAGLGPPVISINMSPRQFNHPNLAERICAVLERHAIDPAWLEIEITENCLARDKRKFLQILAELRLLGLKVAIDDFGTGYSNIGYLKTMHFSSLKIDRSFIVAAETDDNHRALYRAMISMAHNLGLGVVGEGVETEAQAAFLQSIGCNLIQGYYFSKPLPASGFVHYWRERQAGKP